MKSQNEMVNKQNLIQHIKRLFGTGDPVITNVIIEIEKYHESKEPILKNEANTINKYRQPASTYNRE